MDTTDMWTTAQSLPLHMAGAKATPMSPTGREMSAAIVAAMLSQGASCLAQRSRSKADLPR